MESGQPRQRRDETEPKLRCPGRDAHIARQAIAVPHEPAAMLPQPAPNVACSSDAGAKCGRHAASSVTGGHCTW
jgi:hypothetical protein